MAAVMAGGGFKRGYVHGSTDASGMAPNLDPCTPDDLASTIFHQLGIEPTTELQTPTGRPVQLFREGKVIEKLIGCFVFERSVPKTRHTRLYKKETIRPGLLAPVLLFTVL
jgi:hypothetical protein